MFEFQLKDIILNDITKSITNYYFEVEQQRQ